MKKTSRALQFAVFFSIVLLIYSLLNYYIFIRGYQSLQGFDRGSTIFSAVFLFLSLTYIGGSILERIRESIVGRLLIRTGALWLAAMLYLFLAILIVDILHLAGKVIFFIAGVDYALKPWEQPWLYMMLLLITAALITWGYFSARNLRVRSHILHTLKKAPNPRSWKIAVVSDLHLGSIHGHNFLGRVVSRINATKPDLVLIAGDVFDDNVKMVINRDLGSQFRNLVAPFGVYAITGNHEHISGVEPAVAYLENCGIRFLRDEWVIIEDSLVIAGREDRDSSRFSGKHRLPLNLLLKDVPKDYPLVLLDHQPFNLKAKAEAGVDVSFSGHTHHGQLWPLSLITNAIFELSHGYQRIGDSHFIVSSGAGTWGPPVRIGTSAEIIYAEIISHG